MGPVGWPITCSGVLERTKPFRPQIRSPSVYEGCSTCRRIDAGLPPLQRGCVVSNASHRVLVIDDGLEDTGLVEYHLQRIAGFSVDVTRAAGHQDGLRRLEADGADCVVLDYESGASCGLRTLRPIRERGDDTAVILVAGSGNEMLAVEALQCCA